MAIGAVGLVLLAVPGTPALTIGTILGFGLGWSWPGLMQFAVVRLNPSAPAAASAIVQTGVYAGGFAGPIAFGFVAARSSFDTAWLVRRGDDGGGGAAGGAGSAAAGGAPCGARRRPDS